MEVGLSFTACMSNDELDKRIADAMRGYFDLKRDMALLKKKLEHTRKETGETIDFFYDPARNLACAAEILQLHHGRRDMSRLLRRAEVLASGDGRTSMGYQAKESDSAEH